MRPLLMDILRFLVKRDNRSCWAVCVVIGLVRYMKDSDILQTRDFLSSVLVGREEQRFYQQLQGYSQRETSQ